MCNLLLVCATCFACRFWSQAVGSQDRATKQFLCIAIWTALYMLTNWPGICICYPEPSGSTSKCLQLYYPFYSSNDLFKARMITSHLWPICLLMSQNIQGVVSALVNMFGVSKPGNFEVIYSPGPEHRSSIDMLSGLKVPPQTALFQQQPGMRLHRPPGAPLSHQTFREGEYM